MGHTNDELRDANVLSSDSTADADYKVEQKRRERSPFWNPPDGNLTRATSSSTDGGSTVIESLYGFIILGLLIAGFLIVVVVSYAIQHYPAWKSERDQKQAYEQADQARATMKAKHAKAFSDFSPISAWPSEVQRGYAKHPEKSLIAIIDETPWDLHFNKLPPARQTELGAQVWLRISSKGPEAEHVLSELPRVTVKNNVRSRIGSAMAFSIIFLRGQCARGVEPACLDISKAYASMLFEGIDGSGEEAIVKAALKELPSTGPLAMSPNVLALKERLLKML